MMKNHQIVKKPNGNDMISLLKTSDLIFFFNYLSQFW